MSRNSIVERMKIRRTRWLAAETPHADRGPLPRRFSSAYNQFKKRCWERMMIRHYGSRTLLVFGPFVLLLTACVGSSVPGFQLQSVVLGVGEEVFTPDGNLGIRFESVRQDSRCPTDVECPWAGDGEVVLRLQPVGAPAVEQSLHTNASVGPASSSSTVTRCSSRC